MGALRAGYSPMRETDDTTPDEALIAKVTADPALYLERCYDPQALGEPIELPDGSFVKRLPGITRWMWDGEFAGGIQLRWQVGTPDLPRTCLGHIGYSVVRWKWGRGYATSALAQILPLAREVGLPYVFVDTAPDNVASQRVIRKNGAGDPTPYVEPAEHGGRPALRFRIDL